MIAHLTNSLHAVYHVARRCIDAPTTRRALCAAALVCASPSVAAAQGAQDALGGGAASYDRTLELLGLMVLCVVLVLLKVADLRAQRAEVQPPPAPQPSDIVSFEEFAQSAALVPARDDAAERPTVGSASSQA